MVETVPRMIRSETFLEALLEAGVVHEGEYISRVVIDAKVRGAVRVYVERFGDERLLDVVKTLEGIEIMSTPHEHEWVSLRTVADPDDPQACAQCGATRVVPL
jgi:hypothetical protein